MKRGTIRNRKTRRLARRLGVPVYAAVGLLECLWHYAAEQCPRGDVGVLDDEELAEELGWEGDAAALVSALVEARWLDAHPVHRLLIHDWAEHAEDAVQMRMARAGERFADGSMPRMSKLSQREREVALRQYAEEEAGDEGEDVEEPVEDGPAAEERVEPPAAVNGTGRHAVRTDSALESARQCALPGPGPGPKPRPRPLPGRAPRAMAREPARPGPALPDRGEVAEEEPPPAGGVALAGADRGGEALDGRRDASAVPEGYRAADWEEACGVADLLEDRSLESGVGPVTEAGGARRAAALYWSQDDIGFEWPELRAAVVRGAAACAGGGGDGRVRGALRGLRRFPDGALPDRDAKGRGPSRVELLLRLCRGAR